MYTCIIKSNQKEIYNFASMSYYYKKSIRRTVPLGPAASDGTILRYTTFDGAPQLKRWEKVVRGDLSVVCHKLL